MSPSCCLSSRIACASYPPRIDEFCQASAEVRVEDTTYFGVSLKNGTPGSSSTDRVDHAGANISNVRRPSRIAELVEVNEAIAWPMPSVKPNSAVQLGFSNTPSRLTNSCTLIVPTQVSSSRPGFWPGSLAFSTQKRHCEPANVIGAGRC